MAEESAATAPAAGGDGATAGNQGRVDITQPMDAPKSTTSDPSAGASGETKPAQDTPGDKQSDKGGDDTGSDDLFMDPNDLPDELRGHFKRMQRGYTKKMQSLAESKQKVDAYDAFARDPLQTMRNLAAQYGYTLEAKDANKGSGDSSDDAPETWEQVYERATQLATENVMKQMAPYLEQIQSQRTRQIEATLDDVAPEWREYQDEMSQMLQQHPTLVNNPELLARLAIPAEIHEARVHKKVQQKYDAKARSAQVSGGSTTVKASDDDADFLNRKLSFSESVEAAKKKLQKDGIRGG